MSFSPLTLALSPLIRLRLVSAGQGEREKIHPAHSEYRLYTIRRFYPVNVITHNGIGVMRIISHMKT